MNNLNENKDIAVLNEAEGVQSVPENSESESEKGLKAALNKIGVKKLIAIGVAAVLCVALGVVLNISRNNSSKTFSAEGMEITLTGKFVKLPDSQYTVSYGTGDVVVHAVKNDFSDRVPAELSVWEYINTRADEDGVVKNAEKTEENGRINFTFKTEENNGSTYIWHTYVYKTDKAFWIVQFGVSEAQNEAFSEEIEAWADSIKFE